MSQSQGDEVENEDLVSLVIVSSGRAASLLPCGRTPHGAFKIPLELHAKTKKSRIQDVLTFVRVFGKPTVFLKSLSCCANCK